MEIKIYPPVGVTYPYVLNWYKLEIHGVQFSLNHKVHEYKISNMNTFYMQGFEHSTSSMSLNGVLTASSEFVGNDIEDKKDNLINAASAWWTCSDQRIKTNCAQIRWRGWDQYMMIERLSIEKSAGEEEEYSYELSIMIHEGS